jgi:8-oxo-dGTP pyrophosphatase MutT (NUDIX family)
MAMNDVIRQAAAIPYRMAAQGLQVLLITSRQSGRWVVPKGHIEKGFTAAEAAAREAYEEAGIKGVIGAAPLGVYSYGKRLGSGRVREATVEVFALQVIRQVKKWPEQGEREFEWMTPAAAALRVQEPGLAELLRKLGALHGDGQVLPIAG